MEWDPQEMRFRSALEDREEERTPMTDSDTDSVNRSSQNSLRREDSLVLIGLLQKSYSIFLRVSSLLTRTSSGQLSSLRDLRQLAQEVEDFSRVVKVYRLLAEVRNTRNTGLLSPTRLTDASSELIKNYRMLPWILNELYKEATMLGAKTYVEISDARDARSSLSDLIGSVLGAEGRLQIQESLQGTREIEVLDSGFEVRYNLSNDRSIEQEREQMMTEEDTKTIEDLRGQVAQEEQRHTAAQVKDQELFEKAVKATFNGIFTPDELVTLVLHLDLGDATRKDLARWALRHANWGRLEADVRQKLMSTLSDWDRLKSPVRDRRLFIQAKVINRLIWHRWDDDGDDPDDRGQWVIRALEDFEVAGGSLIEEGDDPDEEWGLAFAKVMDCEGDEVFAELREVFAIAAALLWGE